MNEDLFQYLPIELRSKIFSYIPFDNIENCLFVSKYFYETYRCGPESVPEIIFNVPRRDYDYFQPNQLKFYLNIISDKSKKVLKSVEFRKNTPSFSFINKLLIQYNIVNLILPSGSNHVLTSIELSGPFVSIKQLTFGFSTPLDFNRLQVLVDLTPNLQSLTVSCYPCLSQRFYTRDKIFKKLTCFNIATCIKNLPQGRSSPTCLLSKFLTQTPYLRSMSILGEFFQNDFEISFEFLNLLKDLEKFAFEIPYPVSNNNFISKVNNTKVDRLFVKASNQFGLCPIPLLNIKSFYYYGQNLSPILSFQSNGERLKRLVLRSDRRISPNIQTVLELCIRFPNLEQLFIQWLNMPITDLVTIATTCVRLKTVNFDSIDIQVSDITLVDHLSSINSIKDIYLCKKPSAEVVDILINNGFNLYNGEHVWEDNYISIL